MSRPTTLRFESSYRPAEAGARLGPALAAGFLLLTVAWAALHLPALADKQIVDTPLYQEYGERIADGRVPYRDFDVEYPPAAFPLFWLPTLAPADHYRSAFEALVWACAWTSVAFALVALAALRPRPARLYAAAAFLGLAPLALGPVVLTRFDFWPAALTAAALAAFLWERERVGFAVLGLAAAAKLYPLVLLPLALAHVWRRRGPRETAVGLAAFLAVLAAVVGPFLVVAPAGLAESVTGQLGRPLQVESLGAAALLAADRLGWYQATVVSTHGSQNLVGALPDALATAGTVAAALALVAVWALHPVARADGERLVLAAAAGAAAFVAFAKVLSPQFLVWLVPLVPLVAGSTGLAAGVLLGAALVTTHLWFPGRYWDVVALEPVAWLVLVRDLALVALFGVLVAALARRARAGPRTA